MELPTFSHFPKPTLCDCCFLQLDFTLGWLSEWQLPKNRHCWPSPVRVAFTHRTLSERLTRSYSQSCTTHGFYFMAYTSFTASSTDTGCTTSATKISLSSWFFVFADEGYTASNPSTAESSFFSHLSFTSCCYSSRFGPQGVLATGFAPASLSTPYFPHSAVTFSLRTTLFSPLPSSSSLLRPTSTITNLSPPQHSETLSASTGETRKLIIGLVLAVAVVFLLVTMGSSRLCIMRKRQRRRNEFAKAYHDVDKSGGEGENPQLYLQQKAELDDEQWRHEMEAVELRYEMQGADEVVGNDPASLQGWLSDLLRPLSHSYMRTARQIYM